MNELIELIKNPTVYGDFTVFTSIFRLGSSFLLTFVLALTYNYLHSNREDCHVMMHTMIYIAVIMAGAMMMIGANMVVAFGLLGAVSIVRFRTAVRNPIDMSYLFLSIVVGISCGLAFYMHAFILTFFVAFLMLLLSRLKFGMSPPSSISCVVTITAKKESYQANTMSGLKSILGKGAKMLEIKTSHKQVKIKYSQILENVMDARGIHKEIESFFSDDPSLEIRITREV
ncbi:MAG: hypothetical protein B6241_01050 [Spirochaetaceae bacterium 4572_59]|nr:MAG: hypothetical protein B6241_01050 [Spirochaetaceae bacterium 4572_59]